MLTVVATATSYDLTVIETVRAELGIADRSEDENLARWVTQASHVIAEYCNRTFARETVSETFRLASRNSDLLLSRYPVVLIASVVENGETLAASDYEIASESGLLTRLRDDTPTCWPPGKIVIEYAAGYTLLGDLPYGIERAAILLVNQYRFAAERDPQLRSETTDGAGSSSYFDGLEESGLSPEIRGLLAEYRKPAGA
jgi:hypothetical protein